MLSVVPYISSGPKLVSEDVMLLFGFPAKNRGVVSAFVAVAPIIPAVIRPSLPATNILPDNNNPSLAIVCENAFVIQLGELPLLPLRYSET